MNGIKKASKWHKHPALVGAWENPTLPRPWRLKIGPSHSDLLLLLSEVKWWIVKTMFMVLCQFELLGANTSKRTMNENLCRSEILVELKKYFSLKLVQSKGKHLIVAYYDIKRHSVLIFRFLPLCVPHACVYKIK